MNFNIKDDEVLKEGIVHRLDVDTSGIIIIAKIKKLKFFKINSKIEN